MKVVWFFLGTSYKTFYFVKYDLISKETIIVWATISRLIGSFSLKIIQNSIAQVTETKEPGINKDSELMWNTKIKKLGNKLSLHCFVLDRLIQLVNTDINLSYYALVSFRLNYGIVLCEIATIITRVIR